MFHFILLYENDNLKIEMDSADSREVKHKATDFFVIPMSIS